MKLADCWAISFPNGSDVIGRRRFVWLAALLLATALGLAAIM
ncbi:MAG: hypothetical protein R3E79_16315 [Caldilineaceae bacterium]